MSVKKIEATVLFSGMSTLLCLLVIASTAYAQDTGIATTLDASPRRGVASIGIGADERDVMLHDSAADVIPNQFPPDQTRFSEVDVASFPEVSLESNSPDEEPNLDSEAGSDSSSLLAKGPAEWFHSDSGWFGRDGLSASLKAILVMSVLTIAPAILLMTTSYVRVSIVLLLLRQALGAGQVPSNQIIASLSVFLTLLIMSPVGVEVYQKAIEPYSQNQISQDEAFQIGQTPVRTFLWKQIEKTGNVDMIGLFIRYLPDVEEPQYYEDVPWRALAPAFLLSELKTAFLIGFQVFLPFLVIDLVVSCVLVSTGMMMLPPAIVSLPFKLALFVMVDGWTLVVKSLLESFV
ncbi:MAG: flagellar type III secretion system pore protein FliP [Thermoguttaceae bacterium]|jgi:flagellar biosynthetic protein FliP